MNTLKRPNPITFCQNITPEIAAQYLATSPSNRPINKLRVDSLAGAMKRGEWMVTNQGIGFNCNGELRDGHHRLNAVIQSGVTIQSNVTLGLAENVYMAIDQGAKRSTSDVFGGHPTVAQAINFATSLIFGNSHAYSAHHVSVMYKTKIAVLLNELYECNLATRRVVSSAPVRLTAVACVLEGTRKEFVFSQYDALVRSDYDAMTDVSKAFNRQIESRHNARVSTSNKFDMIARARVVFTEARSISKRVVVKDPATASAWIRGIVEQEYASASVALNGGGK